MLYIYIIFMNLL